MVEIFTDHRNLVYFTDAQKLNCRQVRWSHFLTRFDFALYHKPGTTNHADPFSRRPDHTVGVESDNSNRVMFHVRAVHFVDIDSICDRIRASKTMDDEVLITLGLVKSEGPAPLLQNLDDWRQEDDLTFY